MSRASYVSSCVLPAPSASMRIILISLRYSMRWCMRLSARSAFVCVYYPHLVQKSMRIIRTSIRTEWIICAYYLHPFICVFFPHIERLSMCMICSSCFSLAYYPHIVSQSMRTFMYYPHFVRAIMCDFRTPCVLGVLSAPSA